MSNLIVAIHPQSGSTRIVAGWNPDQVLLRARLRPAVPWSRHALPHLLQALALWQGRPVHAVLVVDDKATSSGKNPSFECAVGRTDPLYELRRVSLQLLVPGSDDPGCRGSFAHLVQLLGNPVRR